MFCIFCARNNTSFDPVYAPYRAISSLMDNSSLLQITPSIFLITPFFGKKIQILAKTLGGRVVTNVSNADDTTLIAGTNEDITESTERVRKTSRRS